MEWFEANFRYIAGAAVLIFVGWLIFGRRRMKIVGEGIQINVRCPCGWQGTVSKHAPACRKCGSKDLEKL